MNEIIVLFERERINDFNDLEALEVNVLWVKAAAWVIDAFPVARAEEFFSINVFSDAIFNEQHSILIPSHVVSIILVAGIVWEDGVVLNLKILTLFYFCLVNELSRCNIPCCQS